MILGESLIKEGNRVDGINLIKRGWITADLDKNEFIIHVTHEPIDAKNNIITCGRENGAMLLRWIGANEQTIPNVKIVKIDKLND